MAAAGTSVLRPNWAQAIDHCWPSAGLGLLSPSVADDGALPPSSMPMLVTSQENWRVRFAMLLIVCFQSVTYLNKPTKSFRSPASSLSEISRRFCADAAHSSR